MADLPALAARLLAEHPPAESLDLAFPGWSATVRSNSTALLDELRAYFAGFPAGEGERAHETIHALELPEPDLGLSFVDWKREGGKRGRKDSFFDAPGGRALRKVRTGMQYVMTDDVTLILGPCLTNSNQVINFVNARSMTHQLGQGGVLCHAAAIHGPQGGLAIAGFSGAGKSTTTLHLLAAGHTFVSNDRLIVRRDDDGVIGVGVPKWPRINPGTLLTVPGLADVLPAERRAALEAKPTSELWDLEEKYDLFVARRYGEGRVRLETPLRGLLVLDWQRDGDAETRFERVDLREHERLLGAVEKSPGVFHVRADGTRPTEPQAAPRANYHALLGEIEVYRATGRVDFDAAKAFCGELVG